MAQFSTLLPFLLLFVVFNPIVCPSGQMYNGRRDRAPYIGSSEYSPQYLGDSAGPVGSRFRKAPIGELSSQNQPNNGQQTSTDSIVDQNIRNVFLTNLGPGLYLFKNTAPYVNQPHFNPYTDQMVGDQPDPHPPTSPSSSSDKEFFKVQRSPNGKLSLVYNKNYVPTDETDNSDTQTSSSNNESFGNRYQTHFPGGFPLTSNDPNGSATVNYNRNKDSVHFPTEEPEKDKNNFTVDINDCVEGALVGKTFCTNLRNYPEKKHLEQIIKQRFSNLVSFFGEDLLLPQNLSQRMNNEPDEEFLCKSRTRVIYPQAGFNKDYNWLTIVNIPNYKQGIRVEECINDGSQCGEGNGLSLPNSYSATCKQSYIYRSLVAYANDTVIKDDFKMPSCCKCVLRRG